MQDLPHLYSVTVEGNATDHLSVDKASLPTLTVAPPVEFDGPGDQWSPEELLLASVSTCLVLSFRAIARAGRLEWSDIACESEGELAKHEGKVCFTRVLTKVKLTIPEGTDRDNAEKLLHKADKNCFISNSLSCESHLECEIATAGT